MGCRCDNRRHDRPLTVLVSSPARSPTSRSCLMWGRRLQSKGSWNREVLPSEHLRLPVTGVQRSKGRSGPHTRVEGFREAGVALEPAGNGSAMSSIRWLCVSAEQGRRPSANKWHKHPLILAHSKRCLDAPPYFQGEMIESMSVKRHRCPGSSVDNQRQ